MAPELIEHCGCGHQCQRIVVPCQDVECRWVLLLGRGDRRFPCPDALQDEHGCRGQHTAPARGPSRSELNSIQMASASIAISRSLWLAVSADVPVRQFRDRPQCLLCLTYFESRMRSRIEKRGRAPTFSPSHLSTLTRTS